MIGNQTDRVPELGGTCARRGIYLVAPRRSEWPAVDATLELCYVGRNHSDSSLVMRPPKEKPIFAVDFIPVASAPGLAIIDAYPLEWEESLTQALAMDWERLIPGHLAPGGRLGTNDHGAAT